MVVLVGVGKGGSAPPLLLLTISYAKLPFFCDFQRSMVARGRDLAASSSCTKSRLAILLDGPDVRCCEDAMGRAARAWHHGRCSTATNGAPVREFRLHGFGRGPSAMIVPTALQLEFFAFLTRNGPRSVRQICLTVQTLEVACILYSGPGSHSQLRNGSGSPRRGAQPTIWKRSDSGGLAQSWSAPLIAIVRCGLALQAS
jgi:hypothetical protein